ncbi:MAG: TIGR01777 family oxidoreductase [Halieaceae bacterium]|nr:TIGR01777 family oxidoreductase [Halieaceae bacterium]
MHYLITGGTGFIGTALIEALLRDNNAVTVLTRQSRRGSGSLNFVSSLDGIPADSRFDAVVNLAGASLAGARWTPAYKKEIVSSRLDTTDRLVRFLQRLQEPPEVLLSASAIGYYGHHGDEPLSEEGAVVPGFSQDLCQRWEAAAMAASDIGTRVCLLRFGVVLDRDGGAMVEMARSFQFGVGSWLGGGRQWLSWVHRRDAVAAIRFLQQRADLSGPFNVTAPEPVTSRGFCSAMQRHKRTLFSAPVPAPVMRLLVGEMADELLLKGQRVVPARLEAAGFRFALPTLDAALHEIFAA